METAFSMETKFNFHALQTTICLEVKEVDVLARNGITANQNAKAGFFFSYSFHCGCNLAHGLSFESHVVLIKQRNEGGR